MIATFRSAFRMIGAVVVSTLFCTATFIVLSALLPSWTRALVVVALLGLVPTAIFFYRGMEAWHLTYKALTLTMAVLASAIIFVFLLVGFAGWNQVAPRPN